jgi:hypothetical protein
MAKIKTNASNIPVAVKLTKGQDIINKSTNNADVPGNTQALADFTAAHTALAAAHADAVGTRGVAKQKTTDLKAATKGWHAALNALASHTESVTKGDPSKIQGAGFDVRAAKTPPLALAAVQNLKAQTNGVEGYTKLAWTPLAGASAYVIECSPDPITATSWRPVGNSTRAAFTGNGATAGQKCWYRVAGLNATGQGPWSDPALRPVM